MDGPVVRFAGYRDTCSFLQGRNGFDGSRAIAPVSGSGLLIACTDQELLEEVYFISPGVRENGFIESAVLKRDKLPFLQMVKV